VGVQFEIDANGILHVLARDVKTGRQIMVEMKSAVDVADAEVQKMVEESVEHAFDDLRARQWIESTLRARETVAATRKALAEYGPDTPADQRAAIETALRAVEELLAGTDTAQATGDVGQLKAALARLDEATQPLADLIMDRVTEALLRKRGVIGG
jgi:molecular chaperone DnaK (HSP70)